MHCDTITELWGKQENGIQVGLRHNDQMIDIERLTKGGYVLQNFAIFVEQQSGVSSFEKALGIELKIVYRAGRTVDVPVNYLDISRYEKYYGKLNPISLEEGIKRTAKFMKEELL